MSAARAPRQALALVATYRTEGGRYFNRLVSPVPPFWRYVRVGDRLRRRRDGSGVQVTALLVEHAAPRLETGVAVRSVSEWEATGRAVA